MENKPTRGSNREKTVPRDVYFSDAYFSLRQLGSFAHQLHHIWKMQPTSIIEVGMGNGFVSTYLKRAGIPVTTVDINPNLEPDLCVPLNKLTQHLENKFDLVVCCEVLEHMPLSELDFNLDYLKSAGDRLFMTLPNSKPPFGFGGIMNIPKIGTKSLNFNFDIPYKHKLEGGPHFWEVGYSRDCSRNAIVKNLKTRYSHVSSGKFTLNPNHVYFECQ